MLRKTPGKSGDTATVTFELPALASGATVHLCGEFNDWSKTATPMSRRKDGRFSVSLILETGRSYRYRYLVDGSRWENDWTADSYAPNEFGGDDSVVEL